ncbi:MAG: transcription factor, partial [Candidatus Bathyarchaeia archaeon]
MYSAFSDETLIDIARAIGGEEGVEVIKVLRGVDDITVEELSNKTGIQINLVRKLIYKFYNHSLVTSRRFRDKETGWFIFQWRLQPALIEAFVQGMKQKILRKLQARLEHELQHEFYHCGAPTCPRVTFEEAMETVFHCPHCNEPLKPVDNSASIRFLEKKIAEIEEELKN